MKKVLLALVTIAVVALLTVSNADSKDSKDVIVLSESNTLVLNTEVDVESTARLIYKARQLDNAYIGINKGNKPIYLFLNTPGGDIQAGLDLIEALQGLNRKVKTVTYFAASMGFQIAQNLDERLILKSGTLMSHRARGGVQGEFGGVSPSQLESRLAYYMHMIAEMDAQTVRRTNGKQTMDSYTKSYVPELWVTGVQATAMGYADRIITVRCDSSLSGVEEKSANFMGFEIKFLVDKCPINTGVLDASVNVGKGVVLPTGWTTDKVREAFIEHWTNRHNHVVPYTLK